MVEKRFNFKIQTSNSGELEIPLTDGNAVFVLGANGVGKSALMHSLFTQNLQNSKRILAHRQTWFLSNSMNMTATNKRDNEQGMKGYDKGPYSRWKDEYSTQRSGISIFDLIDSENVRARTITRAVDTDDLQLAKSLSNIQAPLQAINEILAISNIPIIISLGNEEQLFASKNGGELYSIAELSDGERNALLICADVLTTKPGHLIILDEPERHLHRSIISPLLTSLFQKRRDCAFVISTHDISLPIDHLDSSILLLRNCQWNGQNILNWEADLLSDVDNIPHSIKKSIIGSKRDILFIEGDMGSLDNQIYQLIYPFLTIVPQGSCVQVEKAVDGVRNTANLHWVNAYGLIDSDDRTPEQLQALFDKGIAALESYSVESLYYNLEIVKTISKRIADVTGVSVDLLYEKATSGIISSIQSHKERLCARLCEKKVRNILMKNQPKHTDIQSRKEFELKIDLNDILNKEVEIFDELIASNNINGLISRYPIRETPILSNIVTGLGLTRERYESSVRKLVLDEVSIQDFFKTQLTKLTSLVIN